MATLAPEVVAYEDDRALCGGDDGLDVARAIVRRLPHILDNGPASSAWFELDDSHLLDREKPVFGAMVREETGGACVLAEAYDDPFGLPRFAKVLLTREGEE
mmetsp:Transcript_10255/g.30612  ORF Transcript_10255/g.30612 Transcript_10255/m.30612 type:complete len:102 (-) Transcript_10255:29-334(-)